MSLLGCSKPWRFVMGQHRYHWPRVRVSDYIRYLFYPMQCSPYGVSLIHPSIEAVADPLLPSPCDVSDSFNGNVEPQITVDHTPIRGTSSINANNTRHILDAYTDLYGIQIKLHRGTFCQNSDTYPKICHPQQRPPRRSRPLYGRDELLGSSQSSLHQLVPGPLDHGLPLHFDPYLPWQPRRI